MKEKARPFSFFFVILMGIFYWPPALAWVLIYGLVGGFIFKMLSCWQEWWIWARQEIHEWERYPKMAKRKYFEKKGSQVEDKSIYYKVYLEKIWERKYPYAPYPLACIFALAAITFGYSIPRSIGGAIEGPMIVFADAMDFWKTKNLKGRSGL